MCQLVYLKKFGVEAMDIIRTAYSVHESELMKLIFAVLYVS